MVDSERVGVPRPEAPGRLAALFARSYYRSQARRRRRVALGVCWRDVARSLVYDTAAIVGVIAAVGLVGVGVTGLVLDVVGASPW